MNHFLWQCIHIFIFFTCFTSLQCSHESLRSVYSIYSKKPSSDRKENAKIVIGNLAQMIGHVGTIIEQPHDADNVGNAVTNIVNNIVKITVHAIQNKKIDTNNIQSSAQILSNIVNDQNSIKNI